MSGINGTKPKFEQQTLQTERDPETSRYGAPNCQHFHNFPRSRSLSEQLGCRTATH
jgi:hypothetical protein